MEYLHVLSRPKVIDQEHDTVWTEAYIDSTVSRPSVSTPPVRLCALLNMYLNRSLKSIELCQSPLDRVSEYELQMKLLRRQASCAVLSGEETNDSAWNVSLLLSQDKYVL